LLSQSDGKAQRVAANGRSLGSPHRVGHRPPSLCLCYRNRRCAKELLGQQKQSVAKPAIVLGKTMDDLQIVTAIDGPLPTFGLGLTAPIHRDVSQLPAVRRQVTEVFINPPDLLLPMLKAVERPIG